MLKSLSRRARLRAAVATGAALALALSACAGSPNAGTSNGASGAPSADSGPKLDQITVAVPNLPIGFDPIIYNDKNTQLVYKMVNEALYRYTGPDEISPLLADGMPEITDDGKTWTIPLKQGVTFTNGDPFDAEDVAFTIETILNPDNGSYHRNAVKAIESVTAQDDHTVVIKLSQPFSPMMYQLTRLTMISSTVPYKPGDTYANTLIGTGPYKISNITRGQEIKMEPNEDYREEGIPRIPGLLIKAFPDTNSQLAALRNGQVQVIPTLSPATADAVKQFADIYESDSDLVGTRYWLWPNITSGLMSDERLRKAVTIAIDRGRVVDQTFRGYGYPISTLPSAKEGGNYYSPLAQAYGTAPQIEEAKKLVQEAGAVGKKFHMVVPQTAGFAEIADSIQQQLEQIGFEIQREDLSHAAALDRMFNFNYDVYVNGSTTSAGDGGIDGANGLYAKTGAYNLNKVNDDQLDELVAEMVQAEDPTSVIERLRQRQLEYVPDMPIAIGYDLTAMAKGLDGFEMYNYGDYVGLAYVE